MMAPAWEYVVLKLQQRRLYPSEIIKIGRGEFNHIRPYTRIDKLYEAKNKLEGTDRVPIHNNKMPVVVWCLLGIVVAAAVFLAFYFI